MTIHTPESVVKIILRGSVAADILLLIIISAYHVLFGLSHFELAIGVSAMILAYLMICALTLRLNKVRLSAKLIIAFYYCIALCASLIGGVTAPFSFLLYGFFILIGGVLLGSIYIVRTTTITVLTLFILQLTIELEWMPERYTGSTIGAVAICSVLYGIFGLVSWLSSSQTERALHDSLKAKAEMQHQKDLLARALESEEYRRKQLQIEELNNLYQFAEIGQQTTLLFHEFANQLTALSMDIDDSSTTARRHAKATLKEINKTMQSVRQTLSTSASKTVLVSLLLSDIVKVYKAKLQSAHLNMQFHVDTAQYQPVIYGDAIKLRQIITILIDNAIQAYQHTYANQHGIKILLRSSAKTVTISVVDYGVGISDYHRKHLFKPHHTTKVDGHGIGLYIAKRIIEQQFHGTLLLSPATDKTEFIMSLRRIN